MQRKYLTLILLITNEILLFAVVRKKSTKPTLKHVKVYTSTLAAELHRKFGLTDGETTVCQPEVLAEIQFCS